MVVHVASVAPPKSLELLDPNIQSELARIALHISRAKSEVAANLTRTREEHSERAAIREFLGGQSRRVAEAMAIGDVLSIFKVRTTRM